MREDKFRDADVRMGRGKAAQIVRVLVGQAEDFERALDAPFVLT